MSAGSKQSTNGTEGTGPTPLIDQLAGSMSPQEVNQLKAEMRSLMNSGQMPMAITDETKKRMLTSHYYPEYDRVLTEVETNGKKIGELRLMCEAFQEDELFEDLVRVTRNCMEDIRDNNRALVKRAAHLAELMNYDDQGELAKAGVPMKTLLKVAEFQAVKPLMRNLAMLRSKEEWFKEKIPPSKKHPNLWEEAIFFAIREMARAEAAGVRHFYHLSPSAAAVKGLGDREERREYLRKMAREPLFNPDDPDDEGDEI